MTRNNKVQVAATELQQLLSPNTSDRVKTFFRNAFTRTRVTREAKTFQIRLRQEETRNVIQMLETKRCKTQAARYETRQNIKD